VRRTSFGEKISAKNFDVSVKPRVGLTRPGVRTSQPDWGTS
jgi:hypothetical protein